MICCLLNYEFMTDATLARLMVFFSFKETRIFILIPNMIFLVNGTKSHSDPSMTSGAWKIEKRQIRGRKMDCKACKTLRSFVPLLAPLLAPLLTSSLVHHVPICSLALDHATNLFVCLLRVAHSTMLFARSLGRLGSFTIMRRLVKHIIFFPFFFLVKKPSSQCFFPSHFHDATL